MHDRFNGCEMKHLRAKRSSSTEADPVIAASFRARVPALIPPFMITPIRSIFAGLFVSVFLFSISPEALAQNSNRSDLPVADEIVSVVGDQIILRSEVDGLVANMMQAQQISYSDELWASALNELIDQQVLIAHARRDTTIRVTEDQLDQALGARIQQLQAQVGGQSRLEEMYGKSVIEIRAEMRDDFRKRLLAEQFQQNRMRRVRITPTEVEAWFAQFPTDSLPVLPEMARVAHIVKYPPVSEAAREEALEIISTIRDSVTTGTSTFEDMARRFSDDRGSAQLGGRLEEISLRDLVPEFGAVAARIPLGEVSQPFQTQFGYHILRVNNRVGDVIDVNHILIRIDDRQADAGPALEALAVLRDSLLTHNVPFELLARRHSEEEFSSIRGGRVIDPRSGERDLFIEALGSTWRRTLADMNPGDVSEPREVELLDGRRAYHIVKLQRRIPEHRVDIRTDYERIEQFALQEKRAEVFRRWVDDLREQVYIDIRGKGRQVAHHLAIN
jgi:peptidyl-prolyl cis-trans isomerase SurA